MLRVRRYSMEIDGQGIESVSQACFGVLENAEDSDILKGIVRGKVNNIYNHSSQHADRHCSSAATCICVDSVKKVMTNTHTRI